MAGALPSLERKPGGPDNWVERAGGLPPYIERIAKHLHYEKGMSISHAIATAVNTVKRWAHQGKVAKYGDPNHKHVNATTVAKAQKALAQWEAKRAAGRLNLSEVEFFMIDLADAEVAPDNGMICLIPSPEVAAKIAVQGGVSPEDLHVTLTFHPDLGGNKYDLLVEALRRVASTWEGQTKFEGTIGGLGTFPSNDDEPDKTCWWAPVDVPGVNMLHEQISAIASQVSPASETHGYTPHMTLTYTEVGDAMPEPVAPTPVEFHSIWVFRGNEDRTEIPLGQAAGTQTSAELSESATLSRMDILNLAERAGKIEDPDARAAARRRVIELSSSIPPKKASGKATDGRPSYKRQGKWGHGFVPLDQAAKESKAKGSPVAMKRMGRLFGKGKVTKTTTKGRAGDRGAHGRKKDTDTIRVKEKSSPTSEHAQDVGFLRHSDVAGETNQAKPLLPRNNKELNKGGRVPARARQNWDEIPETLKTVRNGVRYVLAEFDGRGYLTKWIGGVRDETPGDLAARKVVTSLTSADLAKMTPGQIKAMLNNPKTPARIKTLLRKASKTYTENVKKGLVR